MKGKKLVLLFLALLLPSFIFIFLKMFGKNEFDVAPLFTESVPNSFIECGINYKFPYHIPDSTLKMVNANGDSLVCVVFQREGSSVFTRVKDKYSTKPLGWKYLDPEKNAVRRRCIFILNEPFDVALVDNSGQIRGQYNSKDRDDMDRLITEIAILLKMY